MFFMPLVQIFQDTRNFTRTTFVSNTIYSLHCCLSRIISYVKCHKYLTFYLLLWGELRWLKAKGKRQAWCLLQVKLYDPCLSALKWFVYVQGAIQVLCFLKEDLARTYSEVINSSNGIHLSALEMYRDKALYKFTLLYVTLWQVQRSAGGVVENGDSILHAGAVHCKQP